MKKKILTFLLCVATIFSTLSLSSCYLLDSKGLSGLVQNGDTTINVEGGDNYDVTINTGESANTLAASKALLSAVSVRADFKKKITENNYSPLSIAFGSGVIYKLNKSGENAYDAYIVTNYHILYNEESDDLNHISEDIDVFLYGHEDYMLLDKAVEENLAYYNKYAIPANFVGGSAEYDIAVLKVENSQTLMKSSARAVDVADSDKVAILDTAIAIGNPEAEGMSVTLGHISVDSEYIDLAIESIVISPRVMRTDAALNHGNSGGGLFNDKGELIGIVNSKTTRTSVDGFGYAIPSNVAKNVAENIIYHCDGTEKTAVQKCRLNIMIETSDIITVYDTKTGITTVREEVRVNSTEGSHLADKLKVGDVLLSITIDGVTKEITRRFQPIDALLTARLGSKITLKILRGTTEMTVEHTVTESMITECK